MNGHMMPHLAQLTRDMRECTCRSAQKRRRSNVHVCIGRQLRCVYESTIAATVADTNAMTDTTLVVDECDAVVGEQGQPAEQAVSSLPILPSTQASRHSQHGESAVDVCPSPQHAHPEPQGSDAEQVDSVHSQKTKSLSSAVAALQGQPVEQASSSGGIVLATQPSRQAQHGAEGVDDTPSAQHWHPDAQGSVALQELATHSQNSRLAGSAVAGEQGQPVPHGSVDAPLVLEKQTSLH